MKILTILGSPRNKETGNTGKVLDWVEKQLLADGHEVQSLHIIDFDVQGCGECFSCKGEEQPELCANEDDDANMIFEKMIEADRVLLATPVFCWGFPAQLKCLIDRMYCLVEDYTLKPDYGSKLKGKPMALLVTSGGPEKGNADILPEIFERMVFFLKGRSVAKMVVPFANKPETLGEETKKRALDFARHLVRTS